MSDVKTIWAEIQYNLCQFSERYSDGIRSNNFSRKNGFFPASSTGKNLLNVYEDMVAKFEVLRERKDSSVQMEIVLDDFIKRLKEIFAHIDPAEEIELAKFGLSRYRIETYEMELEDIVHMPPK